MRPMISQGRGAGLNIKRIVSHGHASPAGFWYDRPRAEWVILLRSAARLRFEDEDAGRMLRAGDRVDIAPHRRHRVEWTDPDAPAAWLAVHYDYGLRRRGRMQAFGDAPRTCGARG